ncbi:hypothetical protein ACJIZ3_006037 [Penstemon smallii]|uniref:DUF4218 domain-containing protein n=1 Tax=Penstemon smallii TaxID=265156 RepID=A0ABD3S6V5_9LAMI
MIYLPIHLAREAMLGGPVQYRWMYPIERYLCKLKRYVNNKAFSEGSKAEGYIVEECLTFCSMYLDDIETQYNKVERNYESCGEKSQQKLEVFSEAPRLLGKGVYKYIDSESWKQAHSYILKNCDEVLPFISEHREELMQQGMPNVEKMHEETFSNWFENQLSTFFTTFLSNIFCNTCIILVISYL